MNKKLIIVTTDMEIELVMLVDSEQINITKEVVEETKDMYYSEKICSTSLLFKDVLSEAMNRCGINFEIIDYEEI